MKIGSLVIVFDANVFVMLCSNALGVMCRKKSQWGQSGKPTCFIYPSSGDLSSEGEGL